MTSTSESVQTALSVSLWEGGRDVPCGRYDGDHVVMPEGGYGELLRRIGHGLRFRFGVAVTDIQYDFSESCG